MIQEEEAMFKIALNLHKPYNYAFFCPVSKLHLTVSNPVGFAHEVTPAISRGLKHGTLIDVDGVINPVTGASVEAGQTQASLPQNPPEPPADDPKNLPEPPADDPKNPPVTDDTGKKKRGRKAVPKAVQPPVAPQEGSQSEEAPIPVQEETPEQIPEPQEEPGNPQSEPETLPVSPEETPNGLFEGIEQ